jgi:hypothetical protein
MLYGANFDALVLVKPKKGEKNVHTEIFIIDCASGGQRYTGGSH